MYCRREDSITTLGLLFALADQLFLLVCQMLHKQKIRLRCFEVEDLLIAVPELDRGLV